MSGVEGLTPEQQTPASVVERLRERERVAEHDGYPVLVCSLLLHDAAALIERLSAEREGLREALQTLTDVLGAPILDRDAVEPSYLKARAALTQEESRQTGEEPVGAAEREVGRAVYERIEKLMDANPKPHTSEWAELTYLAELAETVEEYGSYDGPTCLLALPAAPTPAPAVTTEST
jgi:hypothetical protein